jgi:hypothetical protein
MIENLLLSFLRSLKTVMRRPYSCLEFNRRLSRIYASLSSFLLACALPQEEQLPLQTPFHTWSWTRKRGFATQMHWSNTDMLMENGSLQLRSLSFIHLLCVLLIHTRSCLWFHKHTHGKGSLHIQLLPVPRKTAQFICGTCLKRSS